MLKKWCGNGVHTRVPVDRSPLLVKSRDNPGDMQIWPLLGCDAKEEKTDATKHIPLSHHCVLQQHAQEVMGHLQESWLSFMSLASCCVFSSADAELLHTCLNSGTRSFSL